MTRKTLTESILADLTKTRVDEADQIAKEENNLTIKNTALGMEISFEKTATDTIQVTITNTRKNKNMQYGIFSHHIGKVKQFFSN